MTLSELRNKIFDNKQNDDRAVFKFLKDIDKTQKALCRVCFERIEKGEVELKDGKIVLMIEETPARRICFDMPEELNLGE